MDEGKSMDVFENSMSEAMPRPVWG